MANKKRNKKNKKQKTNETSSSSDNSSYANPSNIEPVSSNSSSAEPLQNLLKATLVRTSPFEDQAIDTDVSSHFESTPETTPDTCSSRLTKNTPSEIPEVFKTNPIFETDEVLLSDAIDSSEFITPPPVPSSPEVEEDNIKENVCHVEEDTIEHMADNTASDFTNTNLTVISDGQFDDIADDFPECFPKLQPDIETDENNENKIVVNAQEYKELEISKNDDAMYESSNSALLEESNFDIDLNYDREIKQPELHFEHKWALEERLIHYQPPELPISNPVRKSCFSDPASHDKPTIPIEMMSSIPDLLTEDDQPISNKTDLVPATSLGSATVPCPRSKLAEEQKSIETSGLNLPILDNHSNYQVESSGSIRTKFIDKQKAIDTPTKMIEPGDEIIPEICDQNKVLKNEPKINNFSRNHFKDDNFSMKLANINIEPDVVYKEIDECKLSGFIPKHISSENEIEHFVTECLQLTRRKSRADECDTFASRESSPSASLALPSSETSSNKTKDCAPESYHRPRTDSSCQTDHHEAYFDDPDELILDIPEPAISKAGFTSNLLSVYRKQRLARQGLDLKLKLLQCHQYVWIHRVLFEAILPSICENNIFLVVNLDPESLIALVRYLYTGFLDLTLETCPCYLRLLESLGDVEFIKDEIVKFLESSISVDNCDQIISMAREYDLNGLGSKIVSKIGSRPSEYRDIILKLCPPDFISLVALDSLNICEKDLLALIKEWITFSDGNCIYIGDVLENVRWETISSEYMVNEIITDPILTQGSGAKTIMEAMGRHLDKNRFKLEMRYRRNALPTILVIGGTRSTDEFPVMTMKDSDWSYSEIQVPEDLRFHFNKLSGHQVIDINGFVYVIGGEYVDAHNTKIISNRILCFDIRLRIWKELRPMIQNRTHFSASVMNDEIFVFGGRCEKGILASTERFSIVENKWYSHIKLEIPRCCHSQITVGDKIYISGGYIQELKKTAKYSNDILIYSSDDLIDRAEMNQPRGWHKMIQLNQNILILGGCFQKTNGRREGINEMERFDLSTLSSETLTQQLLYSTSSPSVFKTDNAVMLTGGWSETEKRFLNSAQEIMIQNSTVQTIQLLNSYLPKHFTTHEATRVIF